MRARAARVEITPAADEALPLSGYGSRGDPHQGIHDSLYVRALVVDDGERQGAVVSCDVLFVTEEMWQRACERLGREVGMAADLALIAAVHTHGAPSSGRVQPEFVDREAGWTRRVEDATR